MKISILVGVIRYNDCCLDEENVVDVRCSGWNAGSVVEHDRLLFPLMMGLSGFLKCICRWEQLSPFVQSIEDFSIFPVLVGFHQLSKSTAVFETSQDRTSPPEITQK